jgi:dTDP-4-dehydrorhamnose reductase
LKIFITGGSGLLGQYLNNAFASEHEIVTLYNTQPGNCLSFDSHRLDLTEWKNLKDLFIRCNPDVVVHTAAVSRPETCDKLSRAEVFEVNVKVTENLAGLCADRSSVMIFTSTDLVYDGNAGGMLTELGRISPESRYAESKIFAEQSVRMTGCNHIILRTSLLYGFGLNHSTNNFHSTYDKFVKGEKAGLFNDQFRTPLALHDAADMIKAIAEKGISNETINFGGNERVSRAELGERLCDKCGFDKNLINSISMNEADVTHKVADVSMNTEKLNSFGIFQKGIEESLEEILFKRNSPIQNS